MNSVSEDIQIYIEEIKDLRSEVEWRLRIAYTAPIYYVSSLFVALGISFRFFYSNAAVSESNSGIGIIGMVFALVNALYVGFLNGNHYIEKKIEVHLLKIQKKISDMTSYDDYFSWLRYGYETQKLSGKYWRFANWLLYSALGLFQFAVPLILAILTLIWTASSVSLSGFLLGAYIVTCIFVLIATYSSIFLLLYQRIWMSEFK